MGWMGPRGGGMYLAGGSVTSITTVIADSDVGGSGTTVAGGGL